MKRTKRILIIKIILAVFICLGFLFTGELLAYLETSCNFGINNEKGPFNAKSKGGCYPFFNYDWPYEFELKNENASSLFVGPGNTIGTKDSGNEIIIKEIRSYAFDKDSVYVEILPSGSGEPIIIRYEDGGSTPFDIVNKYPESAYVIQIAGNLEYFRHLWVCQTCMRLFLHVIVFIVIILVLIIIWDKIKTKHAGT